MSAGRNFTSRTSAGRALGQALHKKHLIDPVILALPRGGVPVAVEVARMLGAPLDLIMVRKIGIPGHPELAAAAIIDGQDPEVVVNERVCTLAGVRRQYIETMARQELAEIERRAGLYLKGRPRVPIAGRTAIIVDDGIATGTTMRAVINALRRKKPKSLVLAVPVAPRETVEALQGQADDIICLESPDPFVAVGVHYDDFRQVSDAEVIELIEGTRAAEKDDRAKVLDQV